MSGQPSAMRQELFVPGSAFAQCHASTIAMVADGLVAAWFAGTAEGHPDTAIWSAQHRDGRWSAPRVLFKLDDQPHWNPVLFRAPDGTLHLWFKTGRDCAVWRSWHAASTDDGRTWGTAEAFLPADDLARGPVRCPPIVAPDGAWLAGASEEQLRDADGREWWPYIERSGDAGRTWTATPIRLESAAPAGKGGIQPTLWASADGGVHCLLRSGLGHIYRADSADAGRTWRRAYATALPNNNSGIAVARLGDGRLVLAWNPVAGDWGPRTPLRLSLSADDGGTWTTLCDLASGAGEFSYPALLTDGQRVVATWTDCRRTIAWFDGSITPEGTVA